jgi:hypothetical protein
MPTHANQLLIRPPGLSLHLMDILPVSPVIGIESTDEPCSITLKNEITEEGHIHLLLDLNFLNTFNFLFLRFYLLLLLLDLDIVI